MDNSIIVYPSDEQGLERLARYMIRSPVSLQRLHYLPQAKQVFYQANKGHDQEDSEVLDSMEFVARVLMHVPDLNKPYSHHYGIYSNRSQHKPRKHSTSAEAIRNEDPPRVSNSKLRRRWAGLIRRVYQTDHEPTGVAGLILWGDLSSCITPATRFISNALLLLLPRTVLELSQHPALVRR